MREYKEEGLEFFFPHCNFREVVCTFEGCNNPIGEWQLSRKRTGYCTLHARKWNKFTKYSKINFPTAAGFHDVPDYRDATLGLDLVSYISTYGVTATSPSAITSTNQDIATLRQVFEGHQNLYYVDTEFFIRSGKYYAYEIALYNWCGALVVDIYVTIPGRLDNPADAITLADSVKFLIKVYVAYFP